ncbi:MAG: DUF3638 domain-containing protein [Chlamydiia bacterium]
MSHAWRKVAVSSPASGVADAVLWTRAKGTLSPESLARGLLKPQPDTDGMVCQASAPAARTLRSRVQDVTIREVGQLDMSEPSPPWRIASIWVLLKLAVSLITWGLRYWWAGKEGAREAVMFRPPAELSMFCSFPGISLGTNPHRERMRALQQFLGQVQGDRASLVGTSANLLEQQIVEWEKVQRAQAELSPIMTKWKESGRLLNTTPEKAAGLELIRIKTEALTVLFTTRQEALRRQWARGESGTLVSIHGDLLQVLKLEPPAEGSTQTQVTRHLLQIGGENPLFPKLSTQALGPVEVTDIIGLDLGPPTPEATVDLPRTLQNLLDSLIGDQDHPENLRLEGVEQTPLIAQDSPLRPLLEAWTRSRTAHLEAPPQQPAHDEIFPIHLMFSAVAKLAESVGSHDPQARPDAQPVNDLFEAQLFKECAANCIRAASLFGGLVSLGLSVTALLESTAAGKSLLQGLRTAQKFVLVVPELLLQEVARRGHLHLGQPWSQALSALHRSLGIQPAVLSIQPAVALQSAPPQGALECGLAAVVTVHETRQVARQQRTADLGACAALIEKAMTERHQEGPELQQRSMLMARLEEIDARTILQRQDLQQDQDLPRLVNALDALKTRLDELCAPTNMVAFDHDEWMMAQRLNILQGTLGLARCRQVLANESLQALLATAKREVCAYPYGDMLYHMFLTDVRCPEELQNYRDDDGHNWNGPHPVFAEHPILHTERWRMAPDRPLFNPAGLDPYHAELFEPMLWLGCAGMIWRPEEGSQDQQNLEPSIQSLQSAHRSLKQAFCNLQAAQDTLSKTCTSKKPDEEYGAWTPASQPSFALSDAETRELQHLMAHMNAPGVQRLLSRCWVIQPDPGAILADLFADRPFVAKINFVRSGVDKASAPWKAFTQRLPALAQELQGRLRPAVQLNLTHFDLSWAQGDHFLDEEVAPRLLREKDTRILPPGGPAGSLLWAGGRHALHRLPPPALGRADLSSHLVDYQSLIRSLAPRSYGHKNKVGTSSGGRSGRTQARSWYDTTNQVSTLADGGHPRRVIAEADGRRLEVDNVRWHTALETEAARMHLQLKDLDILGSVGVDLEEPPEIRWSQVLGLIHNFPEILERPALLGLYVRATLSPPGFQFPPLVEDHVAHLVLGILDQARERFTQHPRLAARLLAFAARTLPHLAPKHHEAFIEKMREPLRFAETMSFSAYLLQALPHLPMAAMHDCLRAAMWLDRGSLLQETNLSESQLLEWRVSLLREADTLTQATWNGDESEWSRLHSAFLVQEWLPFVTQRTPERALLEVALARTLLQPGNQLMESTQEADGSVRYSVQPGANELAPGGRPPRSVTLRLDKGVIALSDTFQLLQKSAYAPPEAYQDIPCLRELVGDRSVFPVRRDEFCRRCLRVAGDLNSDEWIDLVETGEGYFLRGRFHDPRRPNGPLLNWEWSKPVPDARRSYPLLAHHGLWSCKEPSVELLIAGSSPLRAPAEEVYVATRLKGALKTLRGPRGSLLATPCTRGPLSRLIRNCPDARAFGKASGALQRVTFPSLHGLEFEAVSSPGWAKKYLPEDAESAFKVRKGNKEYMWYAPGLELAHKMFGAHFTACSVIPLIDKEGHAELWIIPDSKAHQVNRLPKIIQLNISQRDPDLASLRTADTESLVQTCLFAMSRNTPLPKAAIATLFLLRELSARAAPAIAESEREALIRGLEQTAETLPPLFKEWTKLRIEVISRRWGLPRRPITTEMLVFSVMMTINHRSGGALAGALANALGMGGLLDMVKAILGDAPLLFNDALVFDEAEHALLALNERNLSRSDVQEAPIMGLLTEFLRSSRVPEGALRPVLSVAESVLPQIVHGYFRGANRLLAEALYFPDPCALPDTQVLHPHDGALGALAIGSVDQVVSPSHRRWAIAALVTASLLGALCIATCVGVIPVVGLTLVALQLGTALGTMLLGGLGIWNLPRQILRASPAIPERPSALSADAKAQQAALEGLYGALEPPAGENGIGHHYQASLRMINDLPAGASPAADVDARLVQWATDPRTRIHLNKTLQQMMVERDRSRQWILQALQSVEDPRLSRWVLALRRGDRSQEAEALERALQIWCQGDLPLGGRTAELSAHLQHYLRSCCLQQGVERLLGAGDRPGPLREELERLRVLQASFAEVPQGQNEQQRRQEVALARYRLFLQMQKRIVVRQEQINVIREILDPAAPGRNRVVQARTGFGKTKVVTALALAVAFACQQDWTVVVTEQLLSTTRRDLSPTLEALTGESTLTVKIDRKDLEGSEGIHHAKGWSEKITEMRAKHQPILTTAETIAILEVEIACRLEAHAPDSDLKILRTLHQQLRQGRMLLDEADAILSAIRKLIFSLGHTLPIPTSHARLTGCFFDLLTRPNALDANILTQLYRDHPDVEIGQLQRDIAQLRRSFTTHTTATLLVNEAKSVERAIDALMRMALHEMGYQKWIAIALGHAALPDSFPDRELAKLARQLVHHSLPILFSGAMNREYGFSAERRIGVPFKEGEEEPDTQFSTFGDQLASTFAASCFTTPIDDDYLTNEWQRVICCIRAENLDPKAHNQTMADRLEGLRQEAEATNLQGHGGSVGTILRRLLDDDQQRDLRLFFCEKVLVHHITVYSGRAQRRMSAIIEGIEGAVCITATPRKQQLPSSCSEGRHETDDRSSSVETHAALLHGVANQPIAHLEACPDAQTAAQQLDSLITRNADGGISCQAVLNQAGIGHGVGSRAIAMRWARNFTCQVAFYDPDHPMPRRLITPCQNGSTLELIESEFVDADVESDLYAKTLFYFGPADLRGVDFTVPKSGVDLTIPHLPCPVQTVFTLIPSSTATDTSIEQGAGRARKLGTLHRAIIKLPHGTWEALKGDRPEATHADWLKDMLKRTQDEERRMERLRDSNDDEAKNARQATQRWLYGQGEVQPGDLDTVISLNEQLVDDRWAGALAPEARLNNQAERQVLLQKQVSVSLAKAIEVHHVALPTVTWKESLYDRLQPEADGPEPVVEQLGTRIKDHLEHQAYERNLRLLNQPSSANRFSAQKRRIQIDAYRSKRNLPPLAEANPSDQPLGAPKLNGKLSSAYHLGEQGLPTSQEVLVLRGRGFPQQTVLFVGGSEELRIQQQLASHRLPPVEVNPAEVDSESEEPASARPASAESNSEAYPGPYDWARYQVLLGKAPSYQPHWGLVNASTGNAALELCPDRIVEAGENTAVQASLVPGSYRRALPCFEGYP